MKNYLSDLKSGPASPVSWWRVASTRDGHPPHVVRRLAAGDWRCDCEAWAYGRGASCRHISAAQGWFIIGLEGSYKRPCELTIPSTTIPRGKDSP